MEMPQANEPSNEDKVAYENLTFPGQLDMDCDKTAKECMWNSSLDRKGPEPPEGAGALLCLRSDMVTIAVDD